MPMEHITPDLKIEVTLESPKEGMDGEKIDGKNKVIAFSFINRTNNEMMRKIYVDAHTEFYDKNGEELGTIATSGYLSGLLRFLKNEAQTFKKLELSKIRFDLSSDEIRIPGEATVKNVKMLNGLQELADNLASAAPSAFLNRKTNTIYISLEKGQIGEERDYIIDLSNSVIEMKRVAGRIEEHHKFIYGDDGQVKVERTSNAPKKDAFLEKKADEKSKAAVPKKQPSKQVAKKPKPQGFMGEKKVYLEPPLPPALLIPKKQDVKKATN